MVKRVWNEIKRVLNELIFILSLSLGSCTALAQTAILTHHYNTARTGWNPTETQLTPQTVASQFAAISTTYL
ncbi:MAG TPA: hypothetical protein VME69_04775, partial [Methylocella sp.]|nr:hypothetical protein [Methylocella sp.]